MSGVPLAVRIDGPAGSLVVTNLVSNLRMKSTSPGGYASVEFDLQRPIEASLMAQFTDVLVFDTETGEQVGGGRLLDQGRTVDGSQLVWEVAALGEGMASLQDRTEPYMLIDTQLDAWFTLMRTTKKLQAGKGVAPTSSSDKDGLICDPSEGAIAENSRIQLAHRGPISCGMALGCLAFTTDAGITDSSWRVRGRMHNSGLIGDEGGDYGWSTTTSNRRKFYAGTHFGTGRTVAVVDFQRVDSNVTAGESTWCGVYNTRVSALRLGTNRLPLTGTAYSNEYLTADQAFVDWVARYCPRLDIETATITPGVEQLEQLAWYDGINGLAMLEEVFETEAALTWHVWEKQPNGRWLTEVVALPTTVRYDATIADGFSAPTPSSELYDRVTVRGKSVSGRDVAQTFLASDFGLSVPDLQATGIARSSTIDLGSETWSTGAASGAAKKFLTEHSTLSNAGVLIVAQPIFDRFTGRWVRPWQIRPGELVRYRGTQPVVDGLNPDGADGVTISRIVASNFDSSLGSTSLELDTPTFTARRALAKLLAARTRRK